MKTKILFLIMAALFAVVPISAQTEKHVAAIRGEVNLINKNAKTYRKKVRDVEGISLEGTQATYFSSGKGLRKITAKIYGESYQASLELFYRGEELIFAFEKMSRYNGTIGTEPLKILRVEEKRLYFADGKLIRYLLGKKEISGGSEKFGQEETAMREISQTLKAAY